MRWDWGRTHGNRGAAQLHRVHDASEQAGYKKKHELDELTPVDFELGAELGDAGVKRLSLGELGELDAELGAAGVKAGGKCTLASARRLASSLWTSASCSASLT